MSTSILTPVHVLESPTVPVHRQRLEVVERKGKGHPDTICDAVAEQVSTELSQAYIHTFGRILHYNIDKCLLVAGQVACRLGGGAVKEPIRLILGDRASWGIGRKKIPVADLAIATARRWFAENLPHLDPVKHIRFQIELKPASAELGAIFDRHRGPLPANDTSAAVGYAPLTPTERLVLAVEHYLNGPEFKHEFPDTGEDVKVMAVRVDDELSLTIAMPFLAKAIPTERVYFRRKAEVQAVLDKFVQAQPHGCRTVHLFLNALDRKKKGVEGMYLTLLGTSAEQGDSGQVGRGNRTCGLIALNRPMSGEAAAGKNPVSHVGKIYNVLAHELANHIYQEVPGIEEVTVWFNSLIGRPVDRPLVVAAQVAMKKGQRLQGVQKEIEALIRERLARIPAFCQELAAGRYTTY